MVALIYVLVCAFNLSMLYESLYVVSILIISTAVYSYSYL